jgi:hypothetical protein
MVCEVRFQVTYDGRKTRFVHLITLFMLSRKPAISLRLELISILYKGVKFNKEEQYFATRL